MPTQDEVSCSPSASVDSAGRPSGPPGRPSGPSGRPSGPPAAPVPAGTGRLGGGGPGLFLAAVFLGAWTLFLAAGSDGLYLRDSGELTTAAAQLGVAHETGFPLYCLLARALMFVPLGEIAFRAVLLSALSGALGALLVAALALRLIAAGSGDSSGWPARIGAGAAAALLCGGATYFKAATVAEVYAPTAAAIAVGLLIAARLLGRGGPAARDVLLLALNCGLGLSLHTSLRLLLWPVLLVGALLSHRRGHRWALLAPLWLLWGSLLVLYLPVRALRDPLANWGDASHLGGLWRHLTAARIRESFGDQILSVDVQTIAEQSRAFLEVLAVQQGLALGGAALGLFWLARRQRASGLLILAVILIDAVYAVWINPMGISDWQDGVPCAVGLALAAGCWVGAGVLATRLRFGAAPAIGLAAGAVAVLVLPALLAEMGSKRGVRAAVCSRWVRGALTQMPPRGLLLATSDDLAAGLLYEQGVAGDRPDVAVLVRQLVGDPGYVRRMLTRGDSRWREGAWSGDQGLLARLISRAPGRIGWEPQPGDPVPGEETVVPGAPVFRLGRVGDAGLRVQPPVPRTVATLLMEPNGEVPTDPLARHLGARALVRVAEVYVQQGDPRARPLLREALLWAPEFDSAWIALGVSLAQAGQVAEALRAVHHVLASNPRHTVARSNAARYRRRLENPPVP